VALENAPAPIETMPIVHSLHPKTPQQRTVDDICRQLHRGAVMLYPTDTVPAIGCDLTDKRAIDRVRQIKRLSNDKPLTFLCSSLSNIADYAIVSDGAYRLMKRLIPGPYTFLLPATKLVPRLVMDPKRKTTGIRVPDNAICQTLIETLGNPIISTSANFPQEGESPRWDTIDPNLYSSFAELLDRFAHLVDFTIDDGLDPGHDVSTIVDLTGPEPEIVRKGVAWEQVDHLL
jgi:tRNA threonylcarbamoyl adenosine modification protein (Sua5/YciO/YrdC/YwlC family)